VTLSEIRALVPLDEAEIVPPPELFAHRSNLHGQAHVARVMVHALRLVEATGATGELRRLWASVYLHDLARTHDGVEPKHGAAAWARLETLGSVRALFARAGVSDADHPAIQAAVTMHSAGEPAAGHPHRTLIRLLKDSDGLDRVRLGDLDPRYLRHPEAREMVGFAERLYDATDGRIPGGPDHFARVWRAALAVLAGVRP